MKFLLLLFVACAWANEDMLRDVAVGNIDLHELHKRAISTNSEIRSAARSFSKSLGAAGQIGHSVRNTQLTQSCLGSRPTVRPTIWPTIRTIWPTRIIGPTRIPISHRVGPAARLAPTQLRQKRSVQHGTFVNRDYVFVLDTSGSISDAQFNIAKSVISRLIKALCPSALGHHPTWYGTKQVSVVLFGTTQSTEINFRDSSRGLAYLQDTVLSMRHRKDGSTATPDALKYVRQNVIGKGHSRLNHPYVSTDVIVITDGRCNVACHRLATEADLLRQMGHGVNVLALGVAGARECELEIISGSGFQIHTENFNNLELFAEEIESLSCYYAKDRNVIRPPTTKRPITRRPIFGPEKLREGGLRAQP